MRPSQGRGDVRVVLPESLARRAVDEARCSEDLDLKARIEAAATMAGQGLTPARALTSAKLGQASRKARACIGWTDQGDRLKRSSSALE